MFITFEGIDLSGKSTQAKLLYNYLRKRKKKVILLREPGGTTISERIRRILLDKKNSKMFSLTEFLLFSSARYQLTNEVIKPLLKKGYYVICDRYFDSSTAYQGYGGMVKVKIIREVNKIASDGLIPDITFFVDISLREAEARRQKSGKCRDRMEAKNILYFKKVIAGYRKLARLEPGRFVLLDGKKEIKFINNIIIKKINVR